MTWPTVVILPDAGTTNVDAGTDSPASARSDLKAALDLVNDIKVRFNLVVNNGEPLLKSGSPTDFDIISGGSVGKFRLSAAGYFTDVNKTHPNFFSAGTASGTGISGSTITEFGSGDYATTPALNNSNSFNPTTGRFTAPVAGLYEFEFYIMFFFRATAVAASTKSGLALLRLNGTTALTTTIGYAVAILPYSTSTERIDTSQKILVNLNAGDFVSVWGLDNSGGSSAGSAVYVKMKAFGGKLIST